MKAKLTYLVNGTEQVQEFDSASDAIDHGLDLLLSYQGNPVSVFYEGRTLARQDDFAIMWDEIKRASTVSNG